jgi:antitoxin HigA-1
MWMEHWAKPRMMFSLRLGRYFSMSPQFWLGLQMNYDLDVEEDQLADRLDREVHVLADAR